MPWVMKMSISFCWPKLHCFLSSTKEKDNREFLGIIITWLHPTPLPSQRRGAILKETYVLPPRLPPFFPLLFPVPILHSLSLAYQRGFSICKQFFVKTEMREKFSRTRPHLKPFPARHSCLLLWGILPLADLERHTDTVWYDNVLSFSAGPRSVPWSGDEHPGNKVQASWDRYPYLVITVVGVAESDWLWRWHDVFYQNGMRSPLELVSFWGQNCVEKKQKQKKKKQNGCIIQIWRAFFRIHTFSTLFAYY